MVGNCDAKKLLGRFEQPWKNDKRLKRTWIANTVIYLFLIAGLGLGGFTNWEAIRKVPQHDVRVRWRNQTIVPNLFQYCLVLDDRFSSLDSNTWNHLVQVMQNTSIR